MASTRKTRKPQAISVPNAVAGPTPFGGRQTSDDDEAEIRYSLTALGELAVAQGDRKGRGPRFVGFGPCVAVA